MLWCALNKLFSISSGLFLAGKNSANKKFKSVDYNIIGQMPYLLSFYWSSYMSNFLPIDLIKNFVATDMLLYISQGNKTKMKTKNAPAKF